MRSPAAVTGDGWTLRDAVAGRVLDFTDAGLPPLRHFGPDAEDPRSPCRPACPRGVDVALVEVADGLLQPDTAALLEPAARAEAIDELLRGGRHARGDVLSAVAS